MMESILIPGSWIDCLQSSHSIHTPKFPKHACLYEIHVTVIYSHAILVAVMSECHAVKPGLGH